MQKYCLCLIESALETIMDDGWGVSFKKFDNDKKQDVINDVIKAFEDYKQFVLKGKYVVTGKSGLLLAEDFKKLKSCSTKEECK